MKTSLWIGLALLIAFFPDMASGQGPIPTIVQASLVELARSQVTVAYDDEEVDLVRVKLVQINGRLFVSGKSDEFASVLVAWDHVKAIYVSKAKETISNELDKSKSKTTDQVDARFMIQTMERKREAIASEREPMLWHLAKSQTELEHLKTALNKTDPQHEPTYNVLEKKIAIRSAELGAVEKQLARLTATIQKLDSEIEEARHKAIIDGSYFGVPKDQ